MKPLAILPLRRAVVLLMREKAEVLEADVAMKVRSAHWDMEFPLVIKLVTYIRIPFARAAFSRKAVLARDTVCQYCGKLPSPKNPLTIDHVLPVSRGGTNSWENTVAACSRCNHRKDARTPEEAGMALLREPFMPRFVAIVRVSGGALHQRQRDYLSQFADVTLRP